MDFLFTPEHETRMEWKLFYLFLSMKLVWNGNFLFTPKHETGMEWQLLFAPTLASRPSMLLNTECDTYFCFRSLLHV